MKKLFLKTFGGLSAGYYFRHLFFGALVMAAMIWAMTTGFGTGSHTRAIEPMMIVIMAILTLLYPYAYFVYDNVIGFLMGDGGWLVNGILWLIWKIVVTMMLWFFSFVVAPIGLLYLLYYHSKNGTFDEYEIYE